MKPMQWIVATATAAVMMLSYVHAFIYPRTEGEKTEKRVDHIEVQLLKRIDGLEYKIDRLDTKIDDLKKK